MDFQTTTVRGNEIIIRRGMREETHVFPTAEEAAGRAAIIDYALGWVGTPFVNCCDVKGPTGGIDCVMLTVRAYVDTGRLAPFDPRPYPPDWFLRKNEEMLLGWIEGRLAARRVAEPRLADVLVYQFGRCFSHAAIRMNATEVVHAYAVDGMCTVSRMTEDSLRFVTFRGVNLSRPRLNFDVWDR